MRIVWIFTTVIIAVALSGCFDRESELKRLWRKTQSTGTQQAYLEFLAEQKYGEDGEFEPKGYALSSTDKLRSFAARRALMQIAREDAIGQCPFHTLSVVLEQKVQDAEISFSAKGQFGSKLTDIGISFSDDPDTADETLHIVLRGKAEGAYYTGNFTGDSVRYSITGGAIEGGMWFESASDVRENFSGRKDPASSIYVDESVASHASGNSVPYAVLDAARINDALARLLFKTCSPASAALFYLNNRPKGRPRDEWLEARFIERRENAYPVFLGAAFSGTVYNERVSRELALKMATEDRKQLIRAALHNIWPKLSIPD